MPSGHRSSKGDSGSSMSEDTIHPADGNLAFVDPGLRHTEPVPQRPLGQIGLLAQVPKQFGDRQIPFVVLGFRGHPNSVRQRRLETRSVLCKNKPNGFQPREVFVWHKIGVSQDLH